MEDNYIALSKYFKRPEFTFLDFISSLVIVIIVFTIAYFIYKRNNRKSYYKSYFLPGLAAKMLGGLGYALIYTYYYTYGGDTSGYWMYGQQIAKLLFDYPEYWLEVFSRNFDSSESFVVSMVRGMTFSRSWEEFRMVQITSILAPFGLMNFYATTILLAALCYSGVWRLFLLFRSYYPHSEKGLAIATLFFPSVVFWGSGIMKDTVVFSCIGLLLYSINQMIQNGFFQKNHILIGVITIFLIFSMKAYVLFSLIPGVIIWLTFRYKEEIKNKTLRKIAVPLFIAVSFFGSLYLLEFAGRFNDTYALENFLDGAKSMQNWHYQEGHNTSEQYGRGSSYTLGDYESTPLGIMKVFPAAVNVTFFRPYPWEAQTYMQLLSALESMILLLFSIWVIIKTGFFKTLNIINQNAFLILMVSFSLIFAFAVGFSAYNFGALARYKIPCMPFFIGALIIIKQTAKNEKHVLQGIMPQTYRSHA